MTKGNIYLLELNNRIINLKHNKWLVSQHLINHNTCSRMELRIKRLVNHLKFCNDER